MNSDSNNNITRHINSRICSSQLQKSKPILLQILKKEFDENELYCKYYKLFEYYPVEENESYMVYIIYNSQNKNIIEKKQTIFSCLKQIMDVFSDNIDQKRPTTTQTQNFRNISKIKHPEYDKLSMYETTYQQTFSSYHNSQHTQQQRVISTSNNTENINLDELIEKCLFNIWYIAEYIKDNKNKILV